MASERAHIKGSELISSLKSMGFSVSQEDEDQATLSKGKHRVRIPKGSFENLEEEQAKRLRNELEPAFSEHEEEVSSSRDRVIRQVSEWLRGYTE